MFFRILLISTLLGFSTANAQEVLLNITPVSEFTTAQKYVDEGDDVQFRVIENTNRLRAGDIITGTILKYEANDFFSKHASVTFGNFRTQSGTVVKGRLYLDGTDHPKLEEFTKNISPVWLLRGGEITLKPGVALNFFTEE
jgi:hypothetical protein